MTRYTDRPVAKPMLALATALCAITVACSGGDGTTPASTAGSSARSPGSGTTSQEVAEDATASKTALPEATAAAASRTPAPAPTNQPTKPTDAARGTPGAIPNTVTPMAPPTSEDALEPEPLWVAVARDLAGKHLGLPPGRRSGLALERVEAVRWPSSALGCVQEGFAYAPAEAPGFKITFHHEGLTVTVHADEKGGQAIIPEDCVR